MLNASMAQEPADAPESTQAQPYQLSFSQALAAAKLRYFQGDIPGATEELEGLRLRVAAGEEAPLTLLGEVLIYLGEIYYLDGKSDVAESIFRELLSLDPQFPISPYEHPMEVVGIFEMLRRGYLRPAPDQPTGSKRVPAWGYAPFGVSQFRQNRRKSGALYAGAQAVLGITSVVSYVHLRQVNELGPPPSWTEEQVQRRVRTQRYLIQWPATFGFYALWGASVVEGRRTWRDAQTASTHNLTGVQFAFSREF